MWWPQDPVSCSGPRDPVSCRREQDQLRNKQKKQAGGRGGWVTLLNSNGGLNETCLQGEGEEEEEEGGGRKCLSP